MLKIYIYNDTNEYIGESITMLDPEETKLQRKNVWLMPPNCTTIKPDMRMGYVPIWNGIAWEYIENHRGEKGWVNRIPVEIRELGPLPDGFTTEEPEPTPEELAQQRRQEILAELDRIDRASSRALRAVLAAQSAEQEPDAADVARLAGYEAEAKALRAELAELKA
jgi:hypothetical protein